MPSLLTGPTPLSSARSSSARTVRGRRLPALIALALGGFGIGATEFAAMGMLPFFAQELLPELWTHSQEQANAQAGLLISAYALGVVVGAPTIGASAARYPRKSLLLVLVGGFVLGSVLTALLPGFETVLAARFLSGLGHGAYFGVAALVAASLMGPGRRAFGVALVLGGLTVANVLGVPVVTWIAQSSGFRAAYLGVAVIFAATFAMILLTVPHQAGDPEATIRNELRAFARPQVWYALVMGAVGFGGLFAVYSYISPLITEVAGQELGLVPVVLVLFGVGMTAGNFLGGYFADRGIRRTVLVSFLSVLLTLALYWMLADSIGWAIPLLILLGASCSALSPAIQVRLMDVAGDSKTIAASVNHASLNISNGLGAYLGAVVISAGYGYRAVILVGVAMTVIGLAVALLSFVLERRARG